jgi:hypothetical protein
MTPLLFLGWLALVYTVSFVIGRYLRDRKSGP